MRKSSKNGTPSRSHSRVLTESSSNNVGPRTVAETKVQRQALLKKRELTPSRNPNVRNATIGDGDRLVPIHTEEQMQIAQHCMALFNESISTHNRSVSLPGSPTKSRDGIADSATNASIREQKLRMMRAKSTSDLIDSNATADLQVLSYRRGQAPLAPAGFRKKAAVLYTCVQPLSTMKKTTRVIPKAPEKILDAPTIENNFYLNLLDWGKNNVVAVPLGGCLYMWNAQSGDVDELFKRPDESVITCAKWSTEGKYLSVGLSTGAVKIYDVHSKKCLRTIQDGMVRAGTISWRKNVLTYGNRDGNVYNHDTRIGNSLLSRYSNHRGEVCGLKWSPDELHLTTASADHLVNVYTDAWMGQNDAPPLYTFDEHVSTVKAVEYVPFLGHVSGKMVATGGGMDDNSVKIWNLSNGLLHAEIDVSGINFNRHYREMAVCTAGPENHVKMYQYESKFQLIDEIDGHHDRILCMTQSPCQEFIMTASADETLRVYHCWKMDESMKAAKLAQSSSQTSRLQSSLNNLCIR